MDLGAFTYRAGVLFSAINEDDAPLTFPTSAWTAVAMGRDVRSASPPAQLGITVAISAIGVNALDNTKTDYAMTWTAPGSATETWPTPRTPREVVEMACYLVFTDGSGNTDSSFTFTIRSLPQ